MYSVEKKASHMYFPPIQLFCDLLVHLPVRGADAQCTLFQIANTIQWKCSVMVLKTLKWWKQCQSNTLENFSPKQCKQKFEEGMTCLKKSSNAHLTQRSMMLDAECVKCAGGVCHNVTRRDKTLSASNLNGCLIFWLHAGSNYCQVFLRHFHLRNGQQR